MGGGAGGEGARDWLRERLVVANTELSRVTFGLALCTHERACVYAF